MSCLNTLQPLRTPSKLGGRVFALTRWLVESSVLKSSNKTGFIASSEWEGLKQAIKDLDDEGYILTDDAYYGDEPHLPERSLVKARSFSEKRRSRWIVMVGDLRHGA